MGLFDIKPSKKKVLKKNMSWTQAKAKYPKLSPFKDADRDGVTNWLDCKPFNRKRQDSPEPKDDAVYLEHSKESDREEPMSQKDFESFRKHRAKIEKEYKEKTTGIY